MPLTANVSASILEAPSIKTAPETPSKNLQYRLVSWVSARISASSVSSTRRPILLRPMTHTIISGAGEECGGFQFVTRTASSSVVVIPRIKRGYMIYGCLKLYRESKGVPIRCMLHLSALINNFQII